MNSKIMFRDDKGTLRTIDFGDTETNLLEVQDQKDIKHKLTEHGILVKSKTPVLCLLYNS